MKRLTFAATFVGLLFSLLYTFSCFAAAEDAKIPEECFASPAVYSELKETVGCPDHTAQSCNATLSKLAITCAKCENKLRNDYYTYTVIYSLKSEIKIENVTENETPRYVIWPHDYRVYDRETGKLIECGAYTKVDGADKYHTEENKTKIGTSPVYRKSEYEYKIEEKWQDGNYCANYTMYVLEQIDVHKNQKDRLVFGVYTAPIEASYYSARDYGDGSDDWWKKDWTFIKLIDHAENIKECKKPQKPSGQPADSPEYIISIQTHLRDLGYLKTAADIDGKYGDGTEAAVRSFQSDESISRTGVADIVTQTRLLASVYEKEYENASGGT